MKSGTIQRRLGYALKNLKELQKYPLNFSLNEAAQFEINVAIRAAVLLEDEINRLAAVNDVQAWENENGQGSEA